VLLYPAIDILEGRAVRLRQGHFDDATRYYDDPLDAARAWVAAGARALHVVDLDGARSGAPVNLEAVARICEEAGVPVQLGGGLRNEDAVGAALTAGAERVIVGTAAYKDPAFLDAIVSAHGERVAVAVDVRGGKVSAAGWTEELDLTADEVIERLAGQGVETVIYTDVDRDGMLEGPDAVRVAELASLVSGSLLYSGGIGSVAHLAALRTTGIAGVISGKALFEGLFTVAEGQAALDGGPASGDDGPGATAR
jgi:phosphoribosylformimino-5-aminoimidazole carboxamide ribotide isomerase